MNKNLLKAIVIVALLYLIWLVVAAYFEMEGNKILLSLKYWSLIGVILYVIFLILEIIVYLKSSKKEREEIKIISEALKKVMCSDCKTVFLVSDTGVRPLRYTCPNCGKEGVLRGKTVEGKARKIVCENCNVEFEIFDTGERPLSYSCPNCHFEGVVS